MMVKELVKVLMLRGMACAGWPERLETKNELLRSQRRAAPLALPILDLHTRPAPVLTPSMSEEHANEDAEDAKVKSTYKLTTSKQLRSLTCCIVNL